MSLAGQWRSLEAGLPEAWRTAGLRLELDDRETADRAAGLLGPAQPFRPEPTMLRFSSARNGSAIGPDGVARLLARLDEARVVGRLSIVGSEEAPERREPERGSLAEAWDEALAGLPSDWSDLFCELTLDSSDFVEPAAVLCIQMNPRRDGNRPVFRFRCARVAGYGVSPEMARRCFERCDDKQIHGAVRVLRALSDTHLVATQGPVWSLDGNTI